MAAEVPILIEEGKIKKNWLNFKSLIKLNIFFVKTGLFIHKIKIKTVLSIYYILIIWKLK